MSSMDINRNECLGAKLGTATQPSRDGEIMVWCGVVWCGVGTAQEASQAKMENELRNSTKSTARSKK